MNFECVKCGGCCRQSGALRLLSEDIERISEHIGMTASEFRETYGVKTTYKNLHYIEIDECVFLDGDECGINEVKPFFCENYIPFVDNPGSPIYEVCKGIGKGREWSDDEVNDRYNRMIEKLVIVRE